MIETGAYKLVKDMQRLYILNIVLFCNDSVDYNAS